MYTSQRRWNICWWMDTICCLPGQNCNNLPSEIWKLPGRHWQIYCAITKGSPLSCDLVYDAYKVKGNVDR